MAVPIYLSAKTPYCRAFCNQIHWGYLRRTTTLKPPLPGADAAPTPASDSCPLALRCIHVGGSVGRITVIAQVGGDLVVSKWAPVGPELAPTSQPSC